MFTGMLWKVCWPEDIQRYYVGLEAASIMETNQRQYRRWGWFLVLMFLVSFPLTRGPLHWAIVRGAIPIPIASWIVVLYRPYDWVLDNAPDSATRPIKKLLYRYIELWD